MATINNGTTAADKVPADCGRLLGTNGPTVSPIGLGCMGMSSTYGTSDDQSAIRTIEVALDDGIDYFDTADMYGRGHNERIVGRALRHRRDNVTLATKFGYRFNGIAPDAHRFIDSSGSWALTACEKSLRRLATDYIDLYYLHRRQPDIPVEETIEALGKLVKQGKIRWIGLSEVSPETLRAAHSVHPISAVQMEYSLFTRFVEDEMIETCRELGVALVAYAPTGRGWLTGTLHSRDQLDAHDVRLGHPRFSEEAFSQNMSVVAEVQHIAEKVGASPVQVALAWLLAQGDDIVPIPGTRSVSHMRENLAAIEVSLSPAQCRRLEMLTKEVSGKRHNAENLRYLGK